MSGPACLLAPTPVIWLSVVRIRSALRCSLCLQACRLEANSIVIALFTAGCFGQLAFTDITVTAGTGGPTKKDDLGGHGMSFATTVDSTISLRLPRLQSESGIEHTAARQSTCLHYIVQASNCPLCPSPLVANKLHRAVGIHLALCITAAHARRKYSSYSQEPLLPVCRVRTRSRLGTKAMSWPPEPGL